LGYQRPTASDSASPGEFRDIQREMCGKQGPPFWVHYNIPIRNLEQQTAASSFWSRAFGGDPLIQSVRLAVYLVISIVIIVAVIASMIASSEWTDRKRERRLLKKFLMVSDSEHNDPDKDWLLQLIKAPPYLIKHMERLLRNRGELERAAIVGTQRITRRRRNDASLTTQVVSPDAMAVVRLQQFKLISGDSPNITFNDAKIQKFMELASFLAREGPATKWAHPAEDDAQNDVTITRLESE